MTQIAIIQKRSTIILDVIRPHRWPQVVCGLGVVYNERQLYDLIDLNDYTYQTYGNIQVRFERPQDAKEMAQRDIVFLMALTSQLSPKGYHLITYNPFGPDPLKIFIRVLWRTRIIRGEIDIQTGQYTPTDGRSLSNEQHHTIHCAVSAFYNPPEAETEAPTTTPIDEADLRERLEKIWDILNYRADQQLTIGESDSKSPIVAYTALGHAVGCQFARDLVLGTFPEIFPVYEEEAPEVG